MLDIDASYYSMQFQGKLMNHTWENGKKTLLWAQFRPIWPNSSRQSPPPPSPPTPNIWLRQSLDIMVSYHHVQYQKKLMIQFWENLVMDGWTDGHTDRWTDGQTDKRDLIGWCLTKVERPTNFLEGESPALIWGSAKRQSPQIFEAKKKQSKICSKRLQT